MPSRRAICVVSFQSTLSVRRATAALKGEMDPIEFQSTLSVRRATQLGHSSPSITLFQSTLSVRRATEPCDGRQSDQRISIHALREESDGLELFSNNAVIISIHALREESDSADSSTLMPKFYFNPRSP